jgi:hypothetical protein
MNEHSDDLKFQQAQRRFLLELETGIRYTNQEIIHKRVPDLSSDDILSLVVKIAEIRADYLEAAIQISRSKDHSVTDGTVDDLKKKRQAFEESRAVFQALHEAIEKGYLDISALTTEAAE